LLTPVFLFKHHHKPELPDKGFSSYKLSTFEKDSQQAHQDEWMKVRIATYFTAIPLPNGFSGAQFRLNENY
jgi:hypothetical protein